MTLVSHTAARTPRSSENNRILTQIVQEQTKIKQRLHQIFYLYDFNPKAFSKNFLTTQWTLNLLHAVMTSQGMISELLETYCPRPLQKRTNKDHQALQGLADALMQFVSTLSFIEKQVVTSQLLQLRLIKLTKDQHRLTNYIFAKEHKSLQKKSFNPPRHSRYWIRHGISPPGRTSGHQVLS